MLFGSFVFNLGQLSVIRGFLGFAFQFFLLKWDFLEASLSVGKQSFNFHPPPDLQKLCICFSLVSLIHSLFENVKSWIFFNCLNLKVLIATRHLLFREMSPNCSYTKNNKSIVLQIQNVRLHNQRVLLFLLVSISMKGIEYWREADSFSVCF